MVRTNATLKSQEATLQGQTTSIKNLEAQLGHIVNMLKSKQPSSIPSDIEKNLREHVKVVTLKGGKELK